MNEFTTIITSLSLIGGTVAVGTLSALAALPFIWIARPAFLRWLAAMLIPACLAYCLYWLPVWSGKTPNSAEYVAWAYLFYGAWTLAGVASFGSVMLVGLLARRAMRGRRLNGLPDQAERANNR